MSESWCGRKIAFIVVLFLSAGCFERVANAQIYQDEIARARQIHSEKEGVLLTNVDVGAVAPGENHYSFEVTNSRTTSIALTIEWTANAGLSEGLDRDVRNLELMPGEKKKIEGSYTFQGLSPFAKVSIIVRMRTSEGQPLLRERFHVGAENPAVAYDLSKFGNLSGRHLQIYFLPGTFADGRARSILQEREAGLAKIEQMLGTHFSGTIALFLYPDMATKSADTMHTGEGWAFDRIMVEVYNQETQLDPFHEMTHIIAGTLGSPPPLFDEGFAVYVAETLGAQALEYIVGPGRKIDEVTKEHHQKGRLIPLNELLGVINIGDTRERAEIEYPESASFVKFLIETFGTEKFHEIFSAVKAGDPIEKNRERLEKITGKSLSELDALWRSGF